MHIYTAFHKSDKALTELHMNFVNVGTRAPHVKATFQIDRM